MPSCRSWYHHPDYRRRRLDTLRQAKAQTEQFQYTGFLLENVDHKEG